MIRLALICIAFGFIVSPYLVDKHDYHWEHYTMGDAHNRKAGGAVKAVFSSSPAYDIQGLSDLVERLNQRPVSRSEAIADLWNITPQDLESKVNIYGERE